MLAANRYIYVSARFLKYRINLARIDPISEMRKAK